MQIDDLRKLMDAIAGQIKAFDTKAQIVMGINGILAGQAVNQMARVEALKDETRGVWFVLFFLATGFALVALASSFWFALRTIRPHIEPTPVTQLFFRDLADQYGNDFPKAADALMAVPEPQLAHELGITIQATALICNQKARRCARAITATAVGVTFYVLSLTPTVFMTALQKDGRATKACVMTKTGAESCVVVRKGEDTCLPTADGGKACVVSR